MAKIKKKTKKTAPRKTAAKKTIAKKTPMPKPQATSGAIVTGTDPCVCGGAPEDHGRDPEYPGSTACTHCTDCVAYEADPAETTHEDDHPSPPAEDD